MTKKIIFAGLLFLTIQLNAQFTVGIKSGLTINRTSILESIEPVSDLNSYASSYQFGLVGQYDITNEWSIHSGVSYTDRRSNIEIGTDINVLGLGIPIALSNQFSLKSVDIPLSVAYNYKSGNSTVYPHIGILSSFVQSGAIIPQVRSIIDFNIAQVELPMAQLNSQQFYGLAALGYSYNIGNSSKLFGEVQYNHALEDATSFGGVQSNIRNKGFSVGIGYAMSF